MPYYVRLQPGQKVRLADHDPDADGGLDKQAGRAALAALRKELAELQQELYAAGCNSVLVVLQGMDTSGKDGTIRRGTGDRGAGGGGGRDRGGGAGGRRGGGRGLSRQLSGRSGAGRSAGRRRPARGGRRRCARRRLRPPA